MLMEKARREIVNFGKKMSSDGLSKGTSGNLSVYDPEIGYMAISPSGIDYFETDASDVVVMTLDGAIIEGGGKPSTEYNLHSAFYKNKPDARGVVHTHSNYCTTFACLNMPIKAAHYMIGGAGAAEVPCADYATFGTLELAENAVKACGAGKAVLLANHGLVTCGHSLANAFNLAVNTEFAAEIEWRAMCIGKPVILSDDEMERVMRKFKNYGQQK
jgi:L-fuculose-phosphate aldolase